MNKHTFPLRQSVSAASGHWCQLARVAFLGFLVLSAVSSDEAETFSIRGISQDTTNSTTITWESSTNFIFAVFSADELAADGVWVSRAAMRGQGGATSWTDATTANVDRRFYRVVRMSPDDDFDGDGMPNAWELQYALNPLDPSDAQTCRVCDGTDNLTKYLQGRDPTKRAVADTSELVNLNVFTPLE